MDAKYKDVHIIERSGNEICVARMVNEITIVGNVIVCKTYRNNDCTRVVIPIMCGTKILID